MKEERYFYAPDAPATLTLPEDEAQHAVRVLRLTEGDEVVLMDGRGTFYRSRVAEADKRHCTCSLVETCPQERQWRGKLHLAMAPTKSLDRTEWAAEKATEIGFDALTLLRCQFSERTVVKDERIDRILISAMKQSRKAWKPVLEGMTAFTDFISRDFEGDKFICHCYDEVPRVPLRAALHEGRDTLVLVGPEGDFSIDEVCEAEAHGFVSVSLGHSRLRTETAALVAVHLMHLANEC